MTELGRQSAVGLPIPAPHRLDRGDYVIAAYLGGTESMTLAELTHALGTAGNLVEGRLSGLIRDGMVTQVAAPGRGSVSAFALTQHGRALFEHHRSTNISGLESILSRWDDGDVAALIGYLGRLSDGIDNEYRQRMRRDESAGITATQTLTMPIRTQQPPAPDHGIPRPQNRPPGHGGHAR